jgi:hypothetical protein
MSKCGFRLTAVVDWFSRIDPMNSHISRFFNTLGQWFGQQPAAIGDILWQTTLARYPFLAALNPSEQVRLAQLSSRFLAHKEFSGTQGLQVSDEMAVAIAAQACLPLLHMGPAGARLYDDFKGIVVHPGPMVARREVTDAAGVVHFYTEILAGEAMQYGPIALSWQDVVDSDQSAPAGHNVVIHEFIHKIDMQAGGANGCPPLPSRGARAEWQHVMQASFETFEHQVLMAERFSAEAPWLDAYGAQSPVEFFAVASEAYFVNRQRFEQEFESLTRLFDSFFKPNKPLAPVIIR